MYFGGIFYAIVTDTRHGNGEKIPGLIVMRS